MYRVRGRGQVAKRGVGKLGGGLGDVRKAREHPSRGKTHSIGKGAGASMVVEGGTPSVTLTTELTHVLAFRSMLSVDVLFEGEL